MVNKDESLKKDIIKSIKNKGAEKQNEENKEIILAASEMVLGLISSLAKKFPDGIPYTTLKDETGYSFDLIQVAVMHLIMTQQILGFINDRSTSDLSDDILILREKRIIDEFETSYRTG